MKTEKELKAKIEMMELAILALSKQIEELKMKTATVVHEHHYHYYPAYQWNTYPQYPYYPTPITICKTTSGPTAPNTNTVTTDSWNLTGAVNTGYDWKAFSEMGHAHVVDNGVGKFTN